MSLAASAAATFSQFDEPAATEQRDEGEAEVGAPLLRAPMPEPRCSAARAQKPVCLLSAPQADDREAKALVLALSFVAEYLAADLQRTLFASYDVSAEAVASERKGSAKAASKAAPGAPSWHAEIEAKEAFTSAAAPSSSAEEPASKKPKVAASAAAKKAAPPLKKGQKTMAAFFGKK